MGYQSFKGGEGPPEDLLTGPLCVCVCVCVCVCDELPVTPRLGQARACVLLKYR
jgi:hypothetical protein